MLRKAREFLADDSGATAIEYCLIAAVIAVAIISAVKGVGTKLNTTFSSIVGGALCTHHGPSLS